MFEAATRLFAARGPGDVTLADIAREVGLARTSVYRYFPDKAHLLAAWFRAELAPLHESCLEITRRRASPMARLDAWLTLQLDYLTTPEHRAMVAAAAEIASLPPDVRDELAAGHRAIYDTLETIIAEQLQSSTKRRDPRIVTDLVAGMLRSGASLVIGGQDHDLVLGELRNAARGVIGFSVGPTWRTAPA